MKPESIIWENMVWLWVGKQDMEIKMKVFMLLEDTPVQMYQQFLYKQFLQVNLRGVYMMLQIIIRLIIHGLICQETIEQ